MLVKIIMEYSAVHFILKIGKGSIILDFQNYISTFVVIMGNLRNAIYIPDAIIRTTIM